MLELSQRVISQQTGDGVLNLDRLLLLVYVSGNLPKKYCQQTSRFFPFGVSNDVRIKYSARIGWRNLMDRRRQHRRPYEEYELDGIEEDLISRRKKRASSISSDNSDIEQEHIDTAASYRVKRTGVPRMFGVVFPNRSFPMDASSFTQVDNFHWVLDMNHFVGEAYDQVKEMCIFLLNEFSLPPGKALAVYIQSPGSSFQYCGAVYSACPSAVLSLVWPKPGGQMQITAPDSSPLPAKIGIAAEDVLSLPALNVGKYHHLEELAMKVGKNLFNFMQSFSSEEGGRLVVPLNILEQWFKKFQERARKDPDYLKQFSV